MSFLIIEIGDKDLCRKKRIFKFIANLVFDKKYPLGIDRIIL